MKQPSPALLLIVACSAEDVRRSSDMMMSSLPEKSVTTRFAVNLPEETGRHSTPWTDSSKVGDTIFYTRGRVITTVSINTDSVWTTRPPDRLTLGLPNGPFGLPPDSLCTLGYTGTTLPVVASSVLQRLERTRQCGARTVTTIRRHMLKDSTGNLSVSATRAELATWPWPGVCSRVKDSTIIAFLIGDDVTATEWGPAPVATRLAQWDTIGSLIQARCPDAPVVIRALPTQLEPRSGWQWVTTAWAQYTGPRRHGTPEKFLATEVASAKRQRLGLVAGVNLLNGGCGPAETRQCLPDIPGTTLPGTKSNLYQMSAAEFIYYKTVAMSEPYVCASVDWSWGPNFRSDFHGRSEIRSAAKALGVMAGKRPLAGCVQR